VIARGGRERGDFRGLWDIGRSLSFLLRRRRGEKRGQVGRLGRVCTIRHFRVAAELMHERGRGATARGRKKDRRMEDAWIDYVLLADSAAENILMSAQLLLSQQKKQASTPP
jgi:hypothetical protein